MPFLRESPPLRSSCQSSPFVHFYTNASQKSSFIFQFLVVFYVKIVFFIPRKYTKIPLDSDVNRKFIAQKLCHFLSANTKEDRRFLLKKHVKKHKSAQVTGAHASSRLCEHEGKQSILRTNERRDHF